MASRYVTVNLAGEEWMMPATYQASKQIAETVGDPLQMTVQAASSSGLKWTVEDVISIVFIGARAAGCKLSREKVGEAVVDGGVFTYMRAATEYIASLVTGKSERLSLDGSDTKKE